MIRATTTGRWLLSLSAMLIALTMVLAVSFTSNRVSQLQADDQSETNHKGLLRHVVMFKFKDASSAEDVKKIVTAFGELKSKIPQIHAYEFGTDNSPEGLADGFTHCFLVTFQTAADRDAYLPHPEHQAFVKLLKPHLDKALVVDYWAHH